MILTYKYRLKPKKIHVDKIEHTFDCIHKLKQKYLEDVEEHKQLPVKATELIKYYQNIDPSLIDGLDYSAILNAFIEVQGSSGKGLDKPTRSYTTRVSEYLNTNYPIKDNSIYLPKIGRIKYYNSKNIPKDAAVLRYIVSKNNLDKYFVAIVFEIKDDVKKLNNFENVLGLDYSAKHLAIDNNGYTYDLKIPNEHHHLEMIAEYQRRLSKYKKDSINFKRTKRLINKEYIYLNNCRRDFLHKLSTKMANEYDVISVEDLSLKQLASEKNMGYSTNRNAYYLFTSYLAYKLELKGKKLIKVGKFFPSSKRCSNCGYIYADLTIKERIWTCPSCKATHDRDINAAINIKNEGLRILNCI